jgi:hypothetical protein
MTAAAKPTLASKIWSTKHNRNAEEEQPTHKLQSGIQPLDDALDGGLEFGAIHLLTSTPDTYPQDLLLHFLSSHLLSSPNCHATVIDSTLSFDVRRLHRILQQTLQKTTQQTGPSAIRILEQLKISKVFDDIGLTEAVTEFREAIEADRQVATAPAPPPPPQRIIQDSEDEDEDEEEKEEPPPPRTLLLIDSISHPLTPTLKTNHAQAQTQLSTLLSTLRHLTRTHDLCALVCSAANPAPAAADSPSQFRSCRARPALGHGVGYLVDTHLLLHRVPDADAGAADGRGTRGVVVEVVQDRGAGRIGRWVACGWGVD